MVSTLEKVTRIRMRIKRLAFTFFVILSLGFVISYMFDPPFHPRIHIDASESSDFGLPPEILATYELRFLKPLPHSAYVYCQFESREKTDSKNRRIHVLGLLIDTAQGRRILSVQWDNFRIWPREQQRIQLAEAFLLNGEPQLLLECFHITYPDWFIRIREQYPSLARSLGWLFVRHPTRQYHVARPGTLRKNQTFPKILYPSSQLADTFTGGDSSIGLMSEFQFTSGQWMKKNAWTDAPLPFNCVPVENRAYMGLDLRKRAFIFYQRTDPPSVRQIAWDTIYTLYPQLRQAQVESRAQSLKPPQLTPLTSLPGQSCLLFVSELDPARPVVEIQADQIAAGSPRDIFKIVGDFFPVPPLAAMRNNEILVFTPQNHTLPDLIAADTLFISEREKHPDGSWGRFVTEPTAIPLPVTPSPRRFSRIPLDGDHLLFYHEQALWTVRWDGKEEIQVFPLANDKKG